MNARVAAPAVSRLASPVGELVLMARADGLFALRFAPAADRLDVGGAPSPAAREHLRRAAGELEEYFAGARRRFTVPLAPEGTEFQRAVWAALAEIPFGETWSYRKLAERVGRPGGARAVGQANGRNPLAVLVPCHRVIAHDGSLGGYAGGLWRKERLLALERCSRQG